MRLLILYGSQTGTAEEYAERIARDAYIRGIEYHLSSMNEYPPSQLPEERHVVFLCSTTGDGEMPTNMHSFWRYLLQKSLPGNWLENFTFTVMGLGDSSYEKYNFAGKKLFRRLEQLGARLHPQRADGDEQDPLGHDSAYQPWASELWRHLDAAFQVSVVRRGQLVPPKVIMEKTHRTPTLLPVLTKQFKVALNQRITALDHFQDVRHVVFSTEEELLYNPGDVVAILPFNPPAQVSELLDRLGWADGEEGEDCFWLRPNRPEARLHPSLVSSPTSLRTLLTYYLDIRAPPKRYFFELLSKFIDPAGEGASAIYKEKLSQLSEPAGIDLYLDYVWRPKRTPAEVLCDFPPISIPRNYIMDFFPPLRPREYSISSSCVAHPGTVHITAALVKYETGLSSSREGVCSRWLADLTVGSPVSISIRQGNWPMRLGPKVLIAAGSGVAPMRAFVHHFAATDPNAEIYLFFGCRYTDKDYLYEEEWRKLQEKCNLKVFVLGSRDGGRARQYLSVLLKSHSQLVQELLQRNATFYIAGNSKLPLLVKATIAEICKDANLPERLIRAGRLHVEAWS